jgi:hypothetical protein
MTPIAQHFAPLPAAMDELLPGSFFMRRIPGWTGRWVGAAQAFVRGGSNFTHAGIILDNEQIIQAQPGGAKILSAEVLYSDNPVMVSDAPVQRWVQSQIFPAVLGADYLAEMNKRAEIASKARFLEGIPYSFLDYVALAATEGHWPGWKHLRDRVEDSKHLICSALVDRAYLWADIHLFDDNRLAGDVTPWDLEQYAWRYQADHIARLAEESGQ